MTTIGKILAFMNLVFSVGTVAFIAIVYSTRVNWKTEYERIRKTALTLEATYKEAELRHKNDLASKDEEINSNKAASIDVKNRLDVALQEVKDLKGKLNVQETTTQAETLNQGILKKEVERLQQERGRLKAENEQIAMNLIEARNELNAQRKLTVASESNFKSSQFRNETLLQQVEKLTKELLILQQNSTNNTANASVLTPLAPPPPKDLRGMVKEYDAKYQNAELNIGQNQGLSVGNKLDVFRVDAKNARNSVYLGTILVKRVQSDRSVGKFEPAISGKTLMPGDQVSSSLTGK